ncbi:MAG: twin-arginine translocation signal domain-containing protein, partial [Actinomycetia bacterium]|nr:twin-arginine translocation signal domain-containing protein [Actinomycetes bacterium]
LAGVVARLNEAGLGPADDDAVYLALRDLADVGLIDVHIDLPESVSRRSLLKKLATGAAAGAVLLPVVEMIAAPPAFAQGSNPGPPTPVSPTPVSPTPVSPTPVSPTPVSPTPVRPTPVGPTPLP